MTQRLGVKTGWRDVAAMAALADEHGASVLEYQMLSGDLEHHAKEAFEAFLPYRGRFELRVHQPESYIADGAPRFLDISAPDPARRAEGVAFLAGVARHAMELRAKALIIHPGGVWLPPDIGGSPEWLRESLLDLPKHVRILLENMPAQYAMRTVGPGVIGDVPAGFRIPQGLLHVNDLVDGYVLDISHAYLAVPQGSAAVVRALVRELGSRIVHVHANGARAELGIEHGEGTAFDDSDYGADLVQEVLRGVSPDAVIVPEIMDGHLEGGEGFRAGLSFLTRLRSR